MINSQKIAAQFLPRTTSKLDHNINFINRPTRYAYCLMNPFSKVTPLKLTHSSAFRVLSFDVEFNPSKILNVASKRKDRKKWIQKYSQVGKAQLKKLGRDSLYGRKLYRLFREVKKNSIKDFLRFSSNRFQRLKDKIK